MTDDRLDRLVARLAAEPIDRSLDQLDAEIGRGIARHRAERRAASALAPVGLGAVTLALGVGVAVGGLNAAAAVAEPRQLSTFAVHAHLAPSTLLEGGG